MRPSSRPSVRGPSPSIATRALVPRIVSWTVTRAFSPQSVTKSATPWFRGWVIAGSSGSGSRIWSALPHTERIYPSRGITARTSSVKRYPWGSSPSPLRHQTRLSSTGTMIASPSLAGIPTCLADNIVRQRASGSGRSRSRSMLLGPLRTSTSGPSGSIGSMKITAWSWSVNENTVEETSPPSSIGIRAPIVPVAVPKNAKGHAPRIPMFSHAGAH